MPSQLHSPWTDNNFSQACHQYQSSWCPSLSCEPPAVFQLHHPWLKPPHNWSVYPAGQTPGGKNKLSGKGTSTTWMISSAFPSKLSREDRSRVTTWNNHSTCFCLTCEYLSSVFTSTNYQLLLELMQYFSSASSHHYPVSVLYTSHFYVCPVIISS